MSQKVLNSYIKMSQKVFNLYIKKSHMFAPF